MSKRALIYRHVSSDEQKKNNSPSAQDTDGRAYAAKHGLAVVDSLLEDYTGTTIDRPVFNRVLELADMGAVDAVIVQHPDRLGRGPILELAIALLAKREIEVHACNRGIISDEDDENAQIQNSVDGLVSGIERRNIRRRMTRGMIEKVAVNGLFPGYGTAPYGYHLLGERKQRTLHVDEDEARIVRQIFTWYADGVSAVQICERLDSLGAPIPSVGHDNRKAPKAAYRWTTPMIYRMLRRTMYAGIFHAFSLTSASKKKMHATPIPVAVPAIVAPDLFQRVQERLENGRRLSQRNTKRWYLLRCRAMCGICGCSLVGVTDRKYQYYRCTSVIRRRDNDRQCTAPSYRLEDVDNTVWQWIDTHVLHEANLLAGIQHKNEQTGTERAKLEDEHAHYTAQLEKIAREAQRLLQAYQAEIYTLEELSAEKRRLDTTRSRLEQDRSDVEKRLASVGVSERDTQYLLETVRALRAKVQHLSDDGKRKILDLFDATAVLYVKDGAPWVHIDVALTLQADDVPIVSQSVYGFRL